MTEAPSSPARVALPLAMTLCIASFLAGRYLQPAEAPAAPAPQPVKALALARQLEERREVNSMEALQHASVASATEHGLLPPGHIERLALVASGLMELRPPMQPAASGNAHYTVQPYQILSWYPRIVVYPNFIDAARCAHVVEVARRQMTPSGLAFRPDEKVDLSQQTRTSTGTFLMASQDADGVLSWLEEKIAAVTLLPVNHGEAFNVLHYENLQHYDSHYDTFDPKDFGPQATQRMATVLVYLTNVAEGGETVFKQEGQDGGNRVIDDWRNCDDGSFKYKPRMGDAVLFYSVTPDSKLDKRALHGGCPVKGTSEKWVATKWIHDKPIRA